MAWNDETTNLRMGPIRRSSPSLDRVNQILDEGQSGLEAEIGNATTRMQRTTEYAAPTRAAFTPAEFAMNDQTGEVALPNGQIIKADAPTILQLATLQSTDGTPLPRMQSVPRGFRPISQAEMKRIVDSIPTESDFWGSALAGGKSTLGLAASAIDAMFGNDDPSNAWSRAQQDLPSQQTIGQVKAGQGRWYSSFDSFLSQLGETAGNVGGTIVGALPVAGATAGAGAVSGAGVGAVPGGLFGLGLGLSGGASAFGEQATDFYDTALDALQKMDPATVERESPLYREVVRENPGIGYDEALREVAIRGARSAGTAAGALGAAEGVIGGRLAGNFLARMGVTKSLLGAPLEAVAKRTGAGATALRVGGRAALGGLAAGAEEMGETMLGQAAGAATIGIGSTNPLDYANVDEGIDAALGGILFGALGGRARTPDAVEIAANSDIGAALGANPEANNPWAQRPTLTAEQDAIPAALRREFQGRPGPLPGLSGPAAPTPEERNMVRNQLGNVLAERFGPDWFNRYEQVAQDPAGRQLLGQLIALERDAAADMEQPAYVRRANMGAVDAGQPSLRGPAFGDEQLQLDGLPPQEAPSNGANAPSSAPFNPAQGEMFGPVGPQDTVSEPRGAGVPFNLRERRAAQQMQQEEAAAASAQNPALLEQAPSRSIEQTIFQLEDEVEALRDQLAARPPRDPRRQYFRQALREAEQALAAAEAQWQEARLTEGPGGVAPPNRVDAPPPVAAPQELAPSGDRPMGVAPAPLENPIPMSAAEAASRAQTQAQRRGVTNPRATRQQAAAAAAESEQAVSPSTPEPAGDIAAQVEALLDPASARDAVFIAAGNEAAIPASLPRNVRRVTREGVGTLLTTNPTKAKRFRAPGLTDNAIQQILGYSESKADALRSGEEPVVVQARTPRGVAAEQLASRARAPAARKAVQRLAPKGAKVVETTVDEAQAARAARAPRKREKKAPSPPQKRTAKSDDERTSRKDQDDRTRADRALAQPGAPREAQAPATAAADTVQRAGQRKAERVSAGGKTVTLPASMTRRTGAQGRAVDLRVESIDEESRLAVGSMLAGDTMTASDRAKAEAAMRDFNQLETLLDAAVEAAEARLAEVYKNAPDGSELLREAERRQLEVEQSKTDGQRGRPRTKPRTSSLAYAPLVLSETRGFLRALRDEARAEQDTYTPSTSVARQMVNAIMPNWQEALLSEREGRKIMRALASQTDAQMEEVLPAMHHRIMDSTVAKQVMRGATEVAHAIRRMEQDLAGSRVVVDFADHRIEGVDANVQPHATEHGDIPEGAKGVVNEWVRLFEKGGNKFSAPVHVMSMRDAMKIAPSAFLDGRTPGGKFIRRTDAKGNPIDYILAVHWPAYKFEGAAIEALAHEFGHLVTTELYARTDPRTRMAIDRAYDNWLRSQHGRSVDDILRDQMPGAERLQFGGGRTDRAYATDFHEWAARNAALYLLDPSRQALSGVEKFFKAIAEALRHIYERITGTNKPNRAWEEALDRWVDGTMSVGRMPQVPGVAYNHVGEAFADAPEPKREGTVERARKAVATMKPLADVLTGKADMAQVRQTMQPLTEGKAMDTLKTGGLMLETMRQIERQYRDTPLGPSLSGWVRGQQLKAKTANTQLEAGSRWMELANQLDAKVRTTLERVMYNATHFAVHPDKPLSDPLNAHLLRGPTRVQEVNEQRYRATRALYEAAVRADARVADIYAGLRDAFTDLHRQTLEKQLELIEGSNFTDKVKKQITTRIKAAMAELREGPYFPLMREGNWIVKVQLPSHLVGQEGKENGDYFDTKTAAREEMRNQRALNPGAQVTVERVADEGKWAVRVYQRGVYFFESEAAAKAATDEIMAEVRENYAAHNVDFDEAQAAMEPVDDGDGAGTHGAIISPPFRAREGYEQTKQGSPEFLQEVRTLVNSKAVDPEVGAVLERLAIEALPENNYRKALLPRQNIFGASRQMLRAYAHRYQGAAHYYATVEHGALINRNWQRAWEVNRDYSPAGRVLNVLQANQAEIQKRMSNTTSNRLMNFITDASSLYSLGFSPAYVLTNSLQPWTVTMPVLAGLTKRDGSSVGVVDATKYLKEAYAGALPFFSKRGIADFINETKALMGTRATAQGLQETAKEIITKFGKTEAEQRMLEHLLERGTLDFSWLNSLEDAMRSGKAGQIWANLQRLGMALPQQVEAMNRVTTALAAYRLAKAERLTDGSEAALNEFADDMVADTQLDYSRMNRPLAFNKAGLNVILQFKLYMQGMYMLFVRNATMALRGATAEERKQGRKTIAYLLASHAAAAGAGGLGPVAAVAKLGLVTFAAMSGDDEDDWKSGEQLMRELLQEVFGEYGGTVAEKGLPAMVGIDMSDRIGLPVLADTRFANIREDDTTGETMDKWVLYSLGAPYSNFRRVAQGTSAALAGDWQQAAKGLPSAARAMARSGQWMAEGVVDMDGDQFIPRDQLDWGDLTISALGLSPLTTSSAYQDRTETKQTMARITGERKRLLQAYRTGEDVGEEVAAFNASVPKPFRLTGEQLRRSKEAKADRDKGEVRKEEAAVRRLLGQ